MSPSTSSRRTPGASQIAVVERLRSSGSRVPSSWTRAYLSPLSSTSAGRPDRRSKSVANTMLASGSGGFERRASIARAWVRIARPK
jgi:hypothetical protein